MSEQPIELPASPTGEEVARVYYGFLEKTSDLFPGEKLPPRDLKSKDFCRFLERTLSSFQTRKFRMIQIVSLGPESESPYYEYFENWFNNRGFIESPENKAAYVYEILDRILGLNRLVITDKEFEKLITSRFIKDLEADSGAYNLMARTMTESFLKQPRLRNLIRNKPEMGKKISSAVLTK